MYRRLTADGFINPEFVEGVYAFIHYACSQPAYMDGSKIRCPCRKCKHKCFLSIDEVQLHLLRKGFVPNYFQWTRHGEPLVASTSRRSEEHTSMNLNENVVEDGYGRNVGVRPKNPYRQMVHDGLGHTYEPSGENVDEEPNPQAKQFFNLLQSADRELWPNCETMTQLSSIARILNIKSEGHISDRSFDKILEWYNESLLVDHTMVDSFYNMKKLIRGLGLPVKKIDCCRIGCMLYWGDDINLDQCKFFPWKRMYYFPLTPRLQRLYASEVTASHMRWHAEHEQEDGVMTHPSDALAWKHFNDTHVDFAVDSRNVRLGLSTNGFQPFGQYGQQYSSWPILITPYNLPTWMCMKEAYMSLTVIVPRPTNPKQKIDVFLQPLIAELQQLWDYGVQTYDVSKQQNFVLRAALMWTISDFPAFAMLSGWTTAGKLACPYCDDDSDAFYLPNGSKMCWFDNHRKFLSSDHPFRRNKYKFRKNRTENTQIDELGLLKVTELEADEVNLTISQNFGWRKRSIFWDLPYWKTNLILHNLDVMHIEKNIFDNLFNTIMNIEGRTKDNAKSRADLQVFCKRNELHKDLRTGKYPKACYTLDKRHKELICEWLKLLKFPNGYVSNLARCVDLRKYKLFGMKSHDCHVFMQRLIPIAFRECLPSKVWEAITELSLFFKSLTSIEINIGEMEKLEHEIPVILCKLEGIFPPSFFDCMEHLPVHLPHEAKLVGPVQYRWMYPFERLVDKYYCNNQLQTFINYILITRVEGSICNAYLVEEASTFCGYYFEPHVNTRGRKFPRNDDGGRTSHANGNLSIFSYSGRTSGCATRRMLTEEEIEAAHGYIVLNCEKILPFVQLYETLLREIMPGMTQDALNREVGKQFPRWFERYALDNPIENKMICDLAKGPLRTVKSYPVYFINGYKYHTECHGHNMSTINSGVSIQGEMMDYYGKIIEILEVEYPALPVKRCVIFKCDWYDPTLNVGVKVHKQYNLVEINHRRRLRQFEPFVLAVQAKQVCYIPFPSLRRDKADWLAVCKVKPRGVYESPRRGEHSVESEAFQEDLTFINASVTYDDTEPLNDPSNEFADISSGEDDEGLRSDEEPEFDSYSSEEEDDCNLPLSYDSVGSRFRDPTSYTNT
ncbi:hypothetical protein K2173_023321 [Erythroxylum novogranatense]|uniref:Transposase n=1 Tax=Erythroxylum novogranatense TaxID=1862640 RepID=A0AAV8TVI7_9ROSI|nr:hypothetical protein K2173_023321 [Erythroxylum novogranatense]